MSDFRVAYSSTEDTENFVSQQMQVVHVRVRGEDDPAKQEQIVSGLKQQITQFIRNADSQHRLSGRQHSHFRVKQGGVELQYVNNTGQPFVYIDLPLEQEEPLELEEEEDEPVSAPPFRATAVIEYTGPGGGIVSAIGGGSVVITEPDGYSPEGAIELEDEDGLGGPDENVKALIYLNNTPSAVKALRRESAYNQVSTMNATPKIVGVVPGLTGVEDDFSSPLFDPLSRDVPIFAFGVTHTVDVPEPDVDFEEPGSSGFLSSCTFTQSFPDDIDAWPPLGPILEDGSAAGTSLGQGTLGEDRAQPPENPFNPDNVLLCTRYDIGFSTVGPRGEKNWTNNVNIKVHIYLIDELGPVMRAASGGVSVDGADKFRTTPALDREDNTKQVSFSPEEGIGWYDDGPPINTGVDFFSDGTTTKEQWSTVDFFKRSYVLDIVAGTSSVGTTTSRDAEEPPSSGDRVVEEDVTSTSDLGFLGDVSTDNVGGNIRFEIVAVPIIEGRDVISSLPGWYVNTDFGGGLVDGTSVL